MSYNTDLQSNNIDLQSILDTINALPEAGSGGGIELPTLSSPAEASEVFLGKQTINQSGEVQTGTFTIESELTEQDNLIAQLQSVVDGLPEAPNLQAKTVTPTTSSQTVTADSDYNGLSQVTVNAMPTATQATPTITVNNDGLIIASTVQAAGYVSSGTEIATKQLTTQAAQTIIPTTYDQTITSGKYLTGAQTIKGDPNLVASNIISGVSIFGVTGNGGNGGNGEGANLPELSNPANASEVFLNKEVIDSSGNKMIGTFTIEQELAEQEQLLIDLEAALENKASGGGSDNGIAKAMIERNGAAITSLPNDLTMIGPSAFADMYDLALTSLPDGIKYISDGAFSGCENLRLTSLPSALEDIGGYVFSGCPNVVLTSLPSELKNIGDGLFWCREDLESITLPNKLETISYAAFEYCTNLTAINIPASVINISMEAFACSGLQAVTFEGTPEYIEESAFDGCENLNIINVPWGEDEVSGAPWGAENATINYNYGN